MQAEWGVEAGVEDPVIVVPWGAPDELLHFVDLRKEPARIGEIPETQAYPALRTALYALNDAGTGVWTAKCDAWHLTAEEREKSADELESELAPVGMGSYIDVLLSDCTAFQSFAVHEQLARSWSQAATQGERAQARVEFVVRPAIAEGIPGFGTTVYVFALGSTEEDVERNWGGALGEVVAAILRNPAVHANGTMEPWASSSIG